MMTPKSGNMPGLTDLYVYVTDRCNCACKHCWIIGDARAPRCKPHADLSPDVLESAIAEAKPLGLATLKWTGGEPTIHPGFAAFLDLQKREGLSGRLETNGLELTASLARQLADSGVYHVAVSLDGASPEMHDGIRGVRGAFRKAVRGLGFLVDAGYRPQIIMSLMRENVDQLEDVLALAESIGAESVKLNIIQPTLRGKDLHQTGDALSVAELISINRRVENELKPAHRIKIFFDIPMAFRSLGSMLSGDGCSMCGIKRILGLLPDGHYALCGIGENLPELVFGAAGEGQLPEIWHKHPVLVQLRTGLPGELKGVCSRCLMKGACLGSCVAQNYYRARDLLAPFWFCEAALSEGLFPASRLRESFHP